MKMVWIFQTQRYLELVFGCLQKRAFCMHVGFELFHDGGRYDIETSPLICRANQWTSFYMITVSVMKELIK